MKVIISHDVDHISVSEHLFRDTIIPKFMARMHIELFQGRISLREYTLRWSEIFKNKWQNIDELITFNNIYNIPNSFFIAVQKGVGLNYSNHQASLWLHQMLSRGCEAGVHGIAYDDQSQINSEYFTFRELAGQKETGIRMHYVRNTAETFNMLAKAGYRYDSTEHAFKDPYLIDGMWEFPFQIMDGWIIEGRRKWQQLDLRKAQEITMREIDKAVKLDLAYLGVDFHDRYFSHAFKTWLEWYMWLVEYLKSGKLEFVNFKTAIKELESRNENRKQNDLAV